MFYWLRKNVRFARASFSVLFLLAVAGNTAAQSDWKNDWDKTLAAAKKEGAIVVFGPHSPFYQTVWTGFKKSYPEIKFIVEPGRGSSHLQRVLAERRAGVYRVDIVVGGGGSILRYPPGTQEPIPPLLILPEVTNKLAWWGKTLTYNDPKRQYVLSFSESAKTSTIAYNTKLVKPKEIQSWKDLLNPKWKGKIGSWDPRVRGGGDPYRFFYYNQALGPKFISRLLTDTDIILTRDIDQGLDWLARGRVELYLGSALSTLRAKRQGLPVDIISHSLKEGEIIGGGGACCMAFFNRAPHPNAAKVFANWLLSKEGQISWQKYTQTNSLRTDISKNNVHPAFVPQEGVTYFFANSYRYQSRKDTKALRRIVDEAVRK